MVRLKLIAAVVLLSACASTPRQSPSGQVSGAATPRLAVEQFLKGAKETDIQAMSSVFGTKAGPARETMDRAELEKRQVILACFFTHDTYRILGETAGVGGHRELRVRSEEHTSELQSRLHLVCR